MSSLLVITTCHHYLSSLLVITACHHYLSSLLVITTFHHYLSSLLVITTCHHYFSSLLVITTIHHYYSSLLVITTCHHYLSSLLVITTWSLALGHRNLCTQTADSILFLYLTFPPHPLLCSSWNSEISQIYPQFSLQSINRLERLFCSEIKWDLYISSSAYAKYYFALRSLTEKKDFRR